MSKVLVQNLLSEEKKNNQKTQKGQIQDFRKGVDIDI